MDKPMSALDPTPEDVPRRRRTEMGCRSSGLRYPGRIGYLAYGQEVPGDGVDRRASFAPGGRLTDLLPFATLVVGSPLCRRSFDP